MKPASDTPVFCFESRYPVSVYVGLIQVSGQISILAFLQITFTNRYRIKHLGAISVIGSGSEFKIRILIKEKVRIVISTTAYRAQHVAELYN
jgi:hypothetical protein